MRDKGKL